MSEFTIVIHGGAENKTRSEIGAEKEVAYRKGLDNALNAGWEILNAGGTAIEAVEAAVRCMEDNYLFNAGRGGAYSEKRQNSFDAAIMDGNTLKAGAVGSVTNVKNPISLARLVKDETDHVFLVGDGAVEFAKEMEVEFKSDEYFQSAQQEEELEKALAKKEKEKFEKEDVMKDTVGAVALDKHGNLAAATSTGGLAGQHNGRVGDSPIVGSGVYANNETCAVSCTGDGEGIMRVNVAHEVYALVKYKNLGLKDAAAKACQLYKDKVEGDRNLIALNKQGDVVFQYETKLMFRGCRKGQEPPYVAIWED